jgi:uncharacterized damage-inducible protein DinB
MATKIAQPVIAQLELQTILFRRVLSEITDNEANKSLADHLISIKWIAGHIVNTRISLWSILSGKADDPVYSRLFGKGTSVITSQSFPAMNEILEKWESVTNDLMGSIENCTDGFLMSKPPFQTSIPDTTMMGLIAFMTIHEAHHMGQISVLRKLGSATSSPNFKLYEAVICN